MAAQLLDSFETPRTISWAVQQLAAFTPGSVRREIGKLMRLGFLVRASDRNARRDISREWRDSLAAAHFHCSTRDLVYRNDPEDRLRHFRRKLNAESQPALYKRYPRATRVPFPSKTTRRGTLTLSAALERRRTTRDFAALPVPFGSFADLVRWTFGQTGWIDGGILGSLIAKTSPSAGARHPIECYLLVWRVESLDAGLYHYSVADNTLELLARGDYRRLAVAWSGNQQWIKSAAFLCAMTVVAQRGFWKYSSADAYRTFLLDAGHLAQTFVLVATSLGLGAFTTAALAERRIEKMLRIDGVSEFPIYLCGAGLTQRKEPGRLSSYRRRSIPSGS
jgi:SagB-type dehydrogenase family enzyme